MADLSRIVERLAGTLGPPVGAPQPLAGGITNRNYRLRFGPRDYVVRLPGRETSLLGISRRAEREATRAAAALGIAPPVVAADEECLVTEYVPGRALEPGELRAAPEPAARALRAFHDCGVTLPAHFWVPDLLQDYAVIVEERGGRLPARYAAVQELAGRIAAALPLEHPVPCHDDLLSANLLRNESGELLLVDWEYAGMGHRLFDLGNLAVNNELDEAAEDRLLEAYLGAPPADGARAALKLMKLMSDAREGAWGVIQGVISELEFDFGAYADRHFRRLEEAAADPRLQEWLDAASA